MDSGLHMLIASLKIQDEILRASTARLAAEAKQAPRSVATTTVAPRRHRVAPRRLVPQSLRRVY